jgi:hypothetical protein
VLSGYHTTAFFGTARRQDIAELTQAASFFAFMIGRVLIKSRWVTAIPGLKSDISREPRSDAQLRKFPGTPVSTKSSLLLSEFAVVTDLLVDGPPKPV